MKNLLRFRAKVLVLTAIFLICIVSVLSAQKIAIIDAGSSGSRLYVYELNAQHKLTCLYPTPGISATKGGELYKTVVIDNNVKDFLEKMIRPANTVVGTEIPLYILATAGMREIPNANLVYSKIYAQAGNLGNYVFKGVMTISGRYEGFCAWVAANYKKGGISINAPGNQLVFNPDKQIYGILEIGGASMQIAFPANGSGGDYIQRNGITIYSKSYLNYGVDVICKKYENKNLFYNFTEKLDKISSKDSFLGLGNAFKTAFDSASTKGVSIEEYPSRIKIDDLIHPNHKPNQIDQFHSYMNAYYIASVIEKLQLAHRLVQPGEEISWTEGAALDILLYGLIPEPYNKN